MPFVPLAESQDTDVEDTPRRGFVPLEAEGAPKRPEPSFMDTVRRVVTTMKEAVAERLPQAASDAISKAPAIMQPGMAVARQVWGLPAPSQPNVIERAVGITPPKPQSVMAGMDGTPVPSSPTMPAPGPESRLVPGVTLSPAEYARRKLLQDAGFARTQVAPPSAPSTALGRTSEAVRQAAASIGGGDPAPVVDVNGNLMVARGGRPGAGAVLAPLARGAVQGVEQLYQGGEGFAKAFADLVGWDSASDYFAGSRRERELFGANIKPLTGIGGVAQEAVANIVANAPFYWAGLGPLKNAVTPTQVAAAMESFAVTKAPTMAMSIFSGAGTYNDPKYANLPTLERVQLAASDAFWEFLGEQIGFGETIKAMKTRGMTGEALTQRVKALLGESLGEGLTELGQIENRMLLGLENGMTPKQMLERVAGAAAMGAIVSGGMQAGAGISQRIGVDRRMDPTQLGQANTITDLARQLLSDSETFDPGITSAGMRPVPQARPGTVPRPPFLPGAEGTPPVLPGDLMSPEDQALSRVREILAAAQPAPPASPPAINQPFLPDPEIVNPEARAAAALESAAKTMGEPGLPAINPEFRAQQGPMSPEEQLLAGIKEAVAAIQPKQGESLPTISPEFKDNGTPMIVQGRKRGKFAGDTVESATPTAALPSPDQVASSREQRIRPTEVIEGRQDDNNAITASLRRVIGRQQPARNAAPTVQQQPQDGQDREVNQVTPEQAMRLNTPSVLPTDPVFREAIANTPGATITEGGLEIDAVRFQKPEQEGAESVRTGVFYLPTSSSQTVGYRGSNRMYGGTERHEGKTLLRRPMFVRGAAGGAAPKTAYDTIKGPGAYDAMREDVLRASRRYAQPQAELVQRIGDVLEKYGADRGLASEIVRNSQQGNLLAYATQENIVAHEVRKAGYDSVVGYSKGKQGNRISEIFDVRETTYPARGMESQIHQDFEELDDLEFSQMDTPPKKTRTAYKLLRIKGNAVGKTFPLYVRANEAIDGGVWLQAKSGERQGKGVKSTLGTLAYRPGWHASDLPFSHHIGSDKGADGKPTVRRRNEVWAQVEVGADKDWQSVANERAKRDKKGNVIPKTAQIDDQVPAGGHYMYKTNANMTGQWIIAGEMRVTRILTDEEVAAINKAAGKNRDLPRKEPSLLKKVFPTAESRVFDEAAGDRELEDRTDRDALKAQKQAEREQKKADEKVGMSAANEQRRGVAVLASAKPGDELATVTRRKGRDLARLHARAEVILRAKPARDLLQSLGINGVSIVTYQGSWRGVPELSFFITAKDKDGNALDFKRTRGLGAMLASAFQQDAAITSEAIAKVDEGAQDIVPAMYFGRGDGKPLSAAEVQRAFKAFNAVGEDASLTPDGKSLKFLYFGDEAGYVAHGSKLSSVAKQVGLSGSTFAYNHGVLDSFQEGDSNGNVTEGYTRVVRQTWDDDAAAGSPGVLERATDALLVPYILAAKAEGFGFDFARWQQVNGATRQQRQALEARVAAAEAANRHGLVPRLREKVDISRLPRVPLEAQITQKTTNGNAVEQLSILDGLQKTHPKPLASARAWLEFEAEAFGSNDVPVAPRNLIRQLSNNGAGIVSQLRSLTPGQISDASSGFANGKEFRELYEAGKVPVETTGKLMLWSFLSRGVSPYVQESMFLDAVRGIEPFVRASANGDFGPNKQAEYAKWAEEISRRNGDAAPGNGTTHNLNAFGKLFLARMSERMPDGRTKLQYLHDMFSDKKMTAKEIRREFVKIGQGVGIDNKVISFTMLVIGHTDVVVLDRVQMKNVFDDGSFANYNLYDGTYQTAIRRRSSPTTEVVDDYGMLTGRRSNQITDDYGNLLDEQSLQSVETFATLEQREGETGAQFDERVQAEIQRISREKGIQKSDLIDERAIKPGSGLASMTSGVRGLMLYETIEAELQRVLPGVYKQLGREQDASPGRWHWESWVVTSGQEASHGTLDALLHEVEGRANPFADITVKQGEYGGTDYGVRYARDKNNRQYFLYDDRNGQTYRFTPAQWRQWLAEVKKTFPKDFRISMNEDRTDRSEPWFMDGRIDRAAVDAVTERIGTRDSDRSVEDRTPSATVRTGDGKDLKFKSERNRKEVVALSTEALGHVQEAIDELGPTLAPRDVIEGLTFAQRDHIGQNGAFFPDQRVITLSSDTLERLNSDDPVERKQALTTLAHEISHAVDFGASEGRDAVSMDSPRLRFDWAERGVENGDLFDEAYGAWLNASPDSDLARILSYPLGSVMGGAMNPRLGQLELFAQVSALYNIDPILVRRTMPAWADTLEQIYGNSQTTEGAPQSADEVSQRLREALSDKGAFLSAEKRVARLEGPDRSAGQNRPGTPRGPPGSRVGAPPQGGPQPAGQRTVGGRAGGPGAPGRVARGSVAPTWGLNEPGLTDNLIREWQDKFIDVKQVQKEMLRAAGLVSEDNDTYLAEELYHGRVSTRVNKAVRNHVEPLIEAMRDTKTTADDLGRFLWARHAPERNRQMSKINPNGPTNLSGLYDDAAAATRDGNAGAPNAADIIAGFRRSGKLADMNRLAGMIDTITAATRQILVSEGLEAQSTIDSWNNVYKHYVPLFRDAEQASAGQGFKVVGPESKRAMGSQKEAIAIIAAVISQHERAIIRAERAKVGRALIKLAEDNPNPDFWRVDSPPVKRTINPSTGLVQLTVDPLYRQRDDVFIVKDKGPNGTVVERVITFNPSNERAMAISRAMNNLGVVQLGAVTKAVGRVSRLLANLATSWNPQFWVTNATRDIQTAAINLQSTELEGRAPQIIANIPKAIVGILSAEKGQGTSQWAQTYRAFQDAGGQTGWMQIWEDLRDRHEDIAKLLDRANRSRLDPREIGHKALEYVELTNSAIENAIRVSAFAEAKKIGLSDKRAASIAKNMTVNFNRKGNRNTAANAWYMFFNAQVQGTARMIWGLAKSPRARMYVGMMMAFAAALEMFNRMFYDDDRDPEGNRYYELIPEHVKQKNMIFMLPGGKHTSIPLAYGFNVFFGAGRLIMEAILAASGSGAVQERRKPIDLAWAFGETLIDAFVPLGQTSTPMQYVAPTIADPFVQYLENKTFFGSPMRPEPLPQSGPMPDYKLFFRSTSDTAKDLARWLSNLTGGDERQGGAIDISPTTIEHIVRTATGGVGQFGMVMLDFTRHSIDRAMGQAEAEDYPVRRIPFVGKFYGEVDDRDMAAKYYRLREDATKALKLLKAYQQDGDYEAAGKVEEEKPALIAMGREISSQQFKKAQSEISKSFKAVENMPRDERPKERRQLQRDEAALMARALQAYNDAQEQR